jgi:hypothetical protein
VTALRVDVSLFGKAIPVTVTWAGADTGGSGVARYELQKTLDGGRHWRTVSTTLTTPSTTLTVPSHGTIQFRVRAIDVAKNVGAWSLGTVLKPRLVQDSSRSISYSPRKSWSERESRHYSGESVRTSRVNGSSAAMTTSGTSFALVTTKSSKAGWVRIYVNGTLSARINLGRDKTQYQALVWQTSWTSATAPTIMIVVEAAQRHVNSHSGTGVDLDAFAILK